MFSLIQVKGSATGVGHHRAVAMHAKVMFAVFAHSIFFLEIQVS